MAIIQSLTSIVLYIELTSPTPSESQRGRPVGGTKLVKLVKLVRPSKLKLVKLERNHEGVGNTKLESNLNQRTSAIET